eukprot:comp16494_c0_seq1/m.14493 comp16494_c0_seq1/g.14493  ORF comp16494_c0_seq1/g.14493 comp16494_c0_seq1/m.14493 type:complete len:147 (-) comp16494_c0_seq1:11-451(-)
MTVGAQWHQTHTGNMGVGAHQTHMGNMGMHFCHQHPTDMTGGKVGMPHPRLGCMESYSHRQGVTRGEEQTRTDVEMVTEGTRTGVGIHGGGEVVGRMLETGGEGQGAEDGVGAVSRGQGLTGIIVWICRHHSRLRGRGHGCARSYV